MSKSFFELTEFAVVGASIERAKFGNKVLRSYQQHSLKVTPISKKSDEIEGIKSVGSLTELNDRIKSTNTHDSSQVGVSIVTPPGATKLVLEEGVSQGYRNFFLQPGTYDEAVDSYINETKGKVSDLNVIKSCVLVDLGFSPADGED